MNARETIEQHIRDYDERIKVMDSMLQTLNPETEGGTILWLRQDLCCQKHYRDGLAQALSYMTPPESAVEPLHSVADYPWGDPDFIPCMS